MRAVRHNVFRGPLYLRILHFVHIRCEVPRAHRQINAREPNRQSHRRLQEIYSYLRCSAQLSPAGRDSQNQGVAASESCAIQKSARGGYGVFHGDAQCGLCYSDSRMALVIKAVSPRFRTLTTGSTVSCLDGQVSRGSQRSWVAESEMGMRELRTDH